MSSAAHWICRSIRSPCPAQQRARRAARAPAAPADHGADAHALPLRRSDPAATSPAEARRSGGSLETVNPVAGFLLPDHPNRSKCSDVSGSPIGELSHEPFGGGVTLGDARAALGHLMPARSSISTARAAHGLLRGRNRRRRRERAPVSRRIREGIRAVRAAAGDRHNALDRRYLPRDRQRAHRGSSAWPIAVVRATLMLTSSPTSASTRVRGGGVLRSRHPPHR